MSSDNAFGAPDPAMHLHTKAAHALCRAHPYAEGEIRLSTVAFELNSAVHSAHVRCIVAIV